MLTGIRGLDGRQDTRKPHIATTLTSSAVLRASASSRAPLLGRLLPFPKPPKVCLDHKRRGALRRYVDHRRLGRGDASESNHATLAHSWYPGHALFKLKVLRARPPTSLSLPTHPPTTTGVATWGARPRRPVDADPFASPPKARAARAQDSCDCRRVSPRGRTAAAIAGAAQGGLPAAPRDWYALAGVRGGPRGQ